jgi:hypothetical protein
MPVTMHFKKQKITVIGFTDREDLRYTIHRLIEFERTEGTWPRFHLIQDPEADLQDTYEVTHFLEEMQGIHADMETVRDNLRKDRFEELM